ncbi:two-component system NarL family response regulator DesR (plasmid) [Streptomyces sp. GBA 94-10 4N24]|uniref:response regulator transcription factor n=1 Tax=Streptomyces sp. GBA 94-10 4N24 TaxID=1218177 RepID=UPI0003C30BC3|nr:response regulator transcription factor [Streptomyces sp. GBA 94-10 4N24]ESP95590.1 two-component system NarL family response regulator DesR [Streptomyces sp. GBA 94-10 4N24]UZN63052.1 two-component system NarL family response regulator DesR [Streptomyces sp. GBA 94-10 4N24]
MSIRVLLADDEKLILGALSALLATEDDLEVVGETAGGVQAVEMAKNLLPDVCVLDLSMPDRGGISVVRDLQVAQPSIPCVIVTSHTAPGYLASVMAAGARGFVPKTTPARELAAIIRTVHRGARYIDPVVAADAIAAGDSPLTRREADILALSADGAPIDMVAQRAALSSGTVRNYLSKIAGKLKSANRHEAAYVARRQGWI